MAYYLNDDDRSGHRRSIIKWTKVVDDEDKVDGVYTRKQALRILTCTYSQNDVVQWLDAQPLREDFTREELVKYTNFHVAFHNGVEPEVYFEDVA